MFDLLGSNFFDVIFLEVVNSFEYCVFFWEAVCQFMVLLKNDGILLLFCYLESIVVVGLYVVSIDILLVNYYGVIGNVVIVLEGIINKIGIGIKVFYKYGVCFYQNNVNFVDWVIGSVMSFDVVVVVMGIFGFIEGEEGEFIVFVYKGD